MPPAPASSTHNWERLDGVDLLRGLAIFFVLMNHVNMRLRGAKVPYTNGLPDQLVHSLVWNGQFGVQIFFAVSGFLITSAALKRWVSPSNVNIRDFYLLRFARIAPLLFLLLAILSTLHTAGVPHFVVSTATGGLGRALFAALTFHVNLLEATRGYLPPSWDILWSLSVEETFYLAFPLACRLLGRGKRLIVLLVCFVMLGPFGRTILAHGNPVWKEYSYLGGMDAIALGCLTALFLSRRRLSRPMLRTAGVVGALLMVFILCFSIQAAHWHLERSGLDMSILALGTCMVIASAAQSKWRCPRIFTPVRVLGKRSYEIYLSHEFVLIALFAFFVRAGKPMSWVPIVFVVTMLVSGLAGEMIARVYSEPMNRWLRSRFKGGAGRLSSVIEPAQVETAQR